MLIALEEGCFFELKVVRKNNRYAYLRVKPNRVIEVSAPVRMPRSAILELLHRKKAWIMEMSDAVGESYDEEVVKLMPIDKDDMYLVRHEAEELGYAAMEKVYPLVKPYGISLPNIHVRYMTTKWGSCIADKNKVWLNVYLIKMPPKCTEYVLLRQLLHLRYPEADAAYFELLNTLMPEWRQYEDILAKVQLPPQKMIASCLKIY